jgi:hypothetical protein
MHCAIAAQQASRAKRAMIRVHAEHAPRVQTWERAVVAVNAIVVVQ